MNKKPVSSCNDAFEPCGRSLMLWISRHFVNSILAREPLPDYVHQELSAPLRRRLLQSVEKVWNLLLDFSTEPYLLHLPGCRDLSIHEQAIMIEIDHINESRQISFGFALRSLLQPTALRIIEPVVRDLARIINAIDVSNRMRSERKSTADVIHLFQQPDSSTLH